MTDRTEPTRSRNLLSEAAAIASWRTRRLTNRFTQNDTWIFGKLVELRGNLVDIEGQTFSVKSPAISTRLKSRFLFNRYEQPEREALGRFLDRSLPVVELGASVGVVSCLTNRRLSTPTNHVVVEANPMIVPLLEANKKRNGCSFTVLPRVVAYDGEKANFIANSTNFLGSTATQWDLSQLTSPEVMEQVEVHTTSLRAILDDFHFERCTLICDIEGGEAELLLHEADVLRDRVQMLMLEVHEWFLGKDGAAKVLTDIEKLGFRCVFDKWDTYVFERKR